MRWINLPVGKERGIPCVRSVRDAASSRVLVGCEGALQGACHGHRNLSPVQPVATHRTPLTAPRLTGPKGARHEPHRFAMNLQRR